MKEYLVQINYKSGTSMKFWCKEFKFNSKGAMQWVASDINFRPISVANELSDIESVWQIDSREVPDEISFPVIEE